MKRKNTTRNALFTSIISLLLCVSMLVGTTFAWFTDEVVSGANTIKAGNLDIEVLYANAPDGTYKSIENENDLFVAPAGATKGLWEPGHTEVAYLKVVNNGTLALKYQFMVEAINEVIGKTEDNKDIKLSEILQFAATAPADTAPAAYTRETAQAAAAAADGNLLGYTTGAQMLEAGKAHYIALVAYMPESTGNEANYRGNAVPTISFKLTAIATQVQAENDSFGKDYDAAAPWVGGIDTTWYDPSLTTYTLISPEQLAGFAALTNGTAGAGVSPYSLRSAPAPVDFAGKTVLLGKDINLNNLNWTPIGVFRGTFDGQDHTVYNVNMSGTSCVAFFGDLNGKVQNLKLMNVQAVGTKYVGGIAGYMIECGGVENCHVENATIIANPVADANGVYDDGQHAAGIVGYADNSNITGCSVKNVKVSAYRDLGGIVGTTTASAAKPAPVISNCSGSQIMLSYITVAPYNGGKLNQNAGVIVGRKAKEPTIDQYTLDNVQEAPYQPVAEGVYQNGTTYYVENAAGLSYFSGKAITGNNSTIETVTIELLDNIDMAGAQFSSIVVNYNDTMTVKGNSFTISNVNVVSAENDNSTEQAGMFYGYSGSTLNISDLTLKDITVTTKNLDAGYGSAVIGYCETNAVLNNVDVVNAKITASKSSGLLAGHMSGSLVAENCDVSGTITLSSHEPNGHYAGEYVGTIAGNTTLTNCSANVTMGGNLHAKNLGEIYGRKASGKLTVNGSAVNIKVAATTEDAQAALDSAKPGDVIKLKAGNYDTLTVKNFWGGNYTQTGVEPITIKGGEGVVVGAIDLNGMNFVTIENITFDSAKAVQVYAKSPSGDYGNVVDSANAESQHRGANHITITDCVFTGTPAVDMGKFCPINFMGSNTSSWTYDIVVSGCKFLTNAQNFIRMNNVTEHGSVQITGNTFGGEGYTTNHHCINASANGGDWTITGNTFMNWKSNKTAFATGRSSATPSTDIVITGNTFSNVMYADDDDGVIEIKTNSYPSHAFTYSISGNTYAGGLAGLTDATMIARQIAQGFMPAQ